MTAASSEDGSGWIVLDREGHEAIAELEQVEAQLLDELEPLAEAPYDASELEDEAPATPYELEATATDDRATAEFHVTFASAGSPAIPTEQGPGKTWQVAGIDFRYAVSAPRDMGTGAPAGRRQHGLVTLTKRWGAASPALFDALVRNARFPSVRLDFVRTDRLRRESVYETITLTNASIAAIKRAVDRSAPAGRRDVEEVSLAFAAIEIRNGASKVHASDSLGTQNEAFEEQELEDERWRAWELEDEGVLAGGELELDVLDRETAPLGARLGDRTIGEDQLPPAGQARYDRAGALAYARKFWRQACDDGHIATASRSGFVKVDPRTTFVHEVDGSGQREHALTPDGKRIAWKHLDDCTHFISCCIGTRPGEPCGGLDIAYRQLGSPPAAPYGIVRVATMVDYLTGRAGYAEIVAERTEDESHVAKLAPGDLIAYYSKARRRYSHMAMLLENGKIACHTYCRSDQSECTWDNDWFLGRGTHAWTFLRFVV